VEPRLALVLLLLAGTLTACSSAGASTGGSTPPTLATAPPQPTLASLVPSVQGRLPGSSGGQPDQQAAVNASLADASSHLGITRSSLQVSQVAAREWPDSALGCPRPGLMYSQIVTPGFLIVIAGGGKELEYHTDANGVRVVLCQER
jgi:hypothetical protein